MGGIEGNIKKEKGRPPPGKKRWGQWEYGLVALAGEYGR